jgi:hypothetical protein
MATSKQEKLYNEILEYYNYADKLIEGIDSENEENSNVNQFLVIEEIVLHLEECADKLTAHYIEYIKTGESQKTIEVVRAILNDIAVKIEECKTKTLQLYS